VAKWNFKIVLAGDGAVGKTSIRERYMGKGFTGDYLKTIGADFASKKVKIENHDITFQIWDLAGQDSYSAVRSTFYKGAIASLMVFDCQDPKTMTNLKSWMDEAIEGSKNGILTFFIIANKIDLEEKRRVSREVAIDFCHRVEKETGLRIYYCETSALTGQNIAETFNLLGHKLLEANNIKIEEKLAITDGIIDIHQEIAEGAAITGGVSKEEFGVLKNRMDNIEKKVKTIQTIIKKLVEKMQK